MLNGVLSLFRKPKTVHTLKVWPAYFEAVMSGAKPWEVRKNDRGFKEGDVLVLQEWDPTTKRHTGQALQCRVSYLVNSPPGVRTGYVVMTIRGVRRW
jgi:hypothetical protein